MGQTHVQHFMPQLLQVVGEGKLSAEIIISHRMKLDQAAGAYEMFNEHDDECRKVVLTP